MDHVAIMKKSWGLTEKIRKGEKKIESRWYKTKRNPWNNIKKGDNVYFKDSGEPITLKAGVGKVLQFSNLSLKSIKEILDRYAQSAGIEKEKIPEFFKRFKDKKYCILVFLKNCEEVQPFNIDKTGFGNMAAWIAVKNIGLLKPSSASIEKN
jgi:ASC-1-like (ASCH) protein